MATGCSFTFPPSNLWPVGFGFRPTEEEIITHYLHNKLLGNESFVGSIREVDIYNYEPWELPNLSVFESKNYEWFFFHPLSKSSHKTKTQTKRTTTSGFWKPTGVDREIKGRGTNKVIGSRKILVFHEGKAPNGVRTKWKIHEYRLHTDIDYQRSFVVCRLKEDAKERDVSTCDQDEINNNSHLKRKSTFTQREIQEVQMSSEIQPNEPQPALIQPDQAIDNEVNITDLLDIVDFEDGCFDEEASKMWIDNYIETNLQSPGYSGPEPAALRNSQPPNVYDGMINRSLSPGASNFTEILNSFFLEDGNSDECNQSYNCNKEEVDRMVRELQYGGFSSDTDNDAAFTWQNNETSPRWFNEHTSLGVQSQNMATIKESRRSPLTAKRLQFKEEEDISHLYEKCEPKSSDLVPYESVPRRIRLQSKAVSQDKAKEDVQQKSKAVERKGSGFSYILTTKNIHHKSSLPLVYVAKAFLGIIMFIMFAQEVLLYGSWG